MKIDDSAKSWKECYYNEDFVTKFYDRRQFYDRYFDSSIDKTFM